MHHTPRAPYRLAAPLLALTAALAGCGGGSSDSGGGTTPPTPTQQIDVAFTSPAATLNVYDANTPEYLEVRVDVNGDQVLATIEGFGELRPLRDLADQLADTLERPVRLYLRTIPSQVETSQATSQ